MERCSHKVTRRGLILSVLLIALVAVPAWAVVTKQLYSGTLRLGSRGLGSGVLIFNPNSEPDPPQYMIRTFAYSGQAVVKVGLESVDGSWGLDPSGNPKQVVLCENGGVAGDCTYDSGGNISLQGVIVGPMYGLAGISASQFINSLLRPVGQPSNIKVVLNNGLLGSGVLSRMF